MFYDKSQTERLGGVVHGGFFFFQLTRAVQVNFSSSGCCVVVSAGNDGPSAIISYRNYSRQDAQLLKHTHTDAVHVHKAMRDNLDFIGQTTNLHYTVDNPV